MQPYYQDDYCTIYHGRAEEIQPELERIDYVITDPPYGTGHVSGGGRAGEFVAKKHRASWDVWSIEWLDINQPTAFFGPWSQRFAMQEVAISLLWYEKTNPRPHGPRFEPIAVTHEAVEGTYACYNGDAIYHPYEKPLLLMRWLVGYLTKPNDVVADYFMGSGTTLRAAKDLGRKAIGIEIEERWCEVAAKRLEQEVLPLKFA